MTLRWSRSALVVVLVTATIVAAVASLADAGWTVWPLDVAQTAAALWLALTALVRRGTWANAAVIVAVAWLALFTVPGWIFAARPELLARTTSVDASSVVAVSSIALLALLAGYVALGVAESRRPTVSVRPERVDGRWLAFWFGAGVFGLSALFALNGGPFEYLSNLDRLGSMNLGLLYVIFLSQFMRYAPVAAVSVRWGSGDRVGWKLGVLAAIGVLAGALTGARAFVAVAGVQLLISYALLRRPIRLRVVAPLALLALLALVFGLGTVKRYANYQSAHPRDAVGFTEYATTIAPGEAVDAYATNYADGLRLVGLAVEAVPRYSDYEGLTAVKDFALRAVPRAFRPGLGRSAVLRDTFTPDNGTSLAVPLHATAYLAGGLAAVVLTFTLFGVLVAFVDRRLSEPEPASLTTTVTLIALAVQLPILLRSGVPAGLLFLCLDVAAMWVTTATLTGSLSPSALRRGRRSPSASS